MGRVPYLSHLVPNLSYTFAIIRLLNISKDQLDNLDLSAIYNEFISGSEHRLRFFGKFSNEN